MNVELIPPILCDKIGTPNLRLSKLDLGEPSLYENSAEKCQLLISFRNLLKSLFLSIYPTFWINGLFAWANFSEIYEPINHTRKIIGFDTFSGFPSIHTEDNTFNFSSNEGDLCGDNFNALEESVIKHNYERNLEHINKIELLKGDFLITGKNYIKNNPHLIVSLLYLDFDLYEPTLEALKIFSPRMCKGSIIVFDELNCSNFPGETKAYLEFIQKNNLCLTRSSIDPWISWVQI